MRYRVTIITLVAVISLAAAVALFVQNRQLSSELATARARLGSAEREAESARSEALECQSDLKSAGKSAELNANLAMESVRYLSLLANSGLKEIPGTEEVRKEVLDSAKAVLDRAKNELNSLAQDPVHPLPDDLAKRILAEIHLQAGLLNRDLGYQEKAAMEFRKMNELAEALYKTRPTDSQTLAVLAKSQLTIGEYLRDTKNDLKEAEQYLVRAVKLRLENSRLDPDDLVRVQALLTGLSSLEELYARTGNDVGAKECLEEENILREKLKAVGWEMPESP